MTSVAPSPVSSPMARAMGSQTERMSPFRKRILRLDLHPILVHFTQAFTATIPVLCLAALVGLPRIQAHLQSTILVLGFALPFVVIVSFLAGLLDGKIRFRRVTTPILRRKILFGLMLFLFACAILVVVLVRQPMDTTAIVNILALSLPAVGCSSYLGLLGVRLVNAAFPG